MKQKLRFMREGEGSKAIVTIAIGTKGDVTRIKLPIVELASALMSGSVVECTVTKDKKKGKTK